MQPRPHPVEALRDASDEELLAACARGQVAAWDALLDRYAALIYSIPLKYGLNESESADVFQSVCLTLIEKMHTIRTPRGVAAWLITTTGRECLSTFRRKRREHNVEPGSPVDLPDPAHLPEEELLALERERLVRAAMEQLPENCRDVLTALFSEAADRTSYHDVARDMGMPVNSLGPTRTRCLEKLRRLLVASGFNP